MRNDESLESFVVRRMGRESLDRLAEPLVGGVNGSDPKDMSLAATYPMLLDMEQQYGSLVKGFLAQRKKVEEMKREVPAQARRQAANVLQLVSRGSAVPDRSHGGRGWARRHHHGGRSARRSARETDGSWRVTLDSGEILDR